jgi:hypothetical protein
MSEFSEIAYRLDPVPWVANVLGITPAPWQETFLRAPQGSSLLALTARQVGKTTTAAWAIAHAMLFTPGSLSVVACPAQRQSAEAVRKVREILTKTGAKLTSDNVYGLELENGSRVLALPGSDDSIRGLTVDAWIVADEAARLSDELIAALRPMRARRPQARLAMLSTAWSRTDPFWTAWASDDPTWIRLQATADNGAIFSPEFLESERRALGEHDFNREYLGIPGGAQASPFTWELYARATYVHLPRVLPGPAFVPSGAASPVAFHPDAPATWPSFRPLLLAHDVGRSRDRSTAVIGGNSPLQPRLLGIGEIVELPLGFGTARASALAAVDRRYNSNALIIADLSNDPTYAEVLYETFGPRVIGLHITRNGDGMRPERRQVGCGSVLVYPIGRSYLLELFHTELQADLVRMTDEAMSRRAYEQLANLETEMRESDIIYKCLPGKHDDLGISCAMLAWAARHPHLDYWVRTGLPRRRPRIPESQYGWKAFT